MYALEISFNLSTVKGYGYGRSLGDAGPGYFGHPSADGRNTRVVVLRLLGRREKEQEVHA